MSRSQIWHVFKWNGDEHEHIRDHMNNSCLGHNYYLSCEAHISYIPVYLILF